jgi:prepilin-type N-terminal cleavage/methylation domain-containing protein
MTPSRPTRAWTRSATAPAAGRGFTLLEVLLAMVVLGIAIVGIAQGFAIGLRANVIARDTTTAMSLARIKLAELDAGLIGVTQDDEGTFEDYGEPDFAWSIDSNTSELPGLYEITLRVTWPERGGTRDYTVVQWMLDRQAGALNGLLESGALSPAQR